MHTLGALRTLHGQVKHILQKYPDSRNSDLVLQSKLAYEFLPPLTEPIWGWKDLVRAMQNVPSLDHIARVRRKVVAEQPELMPTSLDVAKARKINEDTWRAYNSFGGPRTPAQRAASNIPEGYDENKL